MALDDRVPTITSPMAIPAASPTQDLQYLTLHQ